MFLGHLSAFVRPGSVWGQRPLLLRDSHRDLPHAGLAASMDFGWLLAGLTGTPLRGATVSVLIWYGIAAQGEIHFQLEKQICDAPFPLQE